MIDWFRWSAGATIVTAETTAGDCRMIDAGTGEAGRVVTEVTVAGG